MSEPVRRPSDSDVVPADEPRPRLGRNVYALGAVSFFTDVASEMIYPLLPIFLTSVLATGAGFVGAIEGAAESTAALLKLVSGWWSDRMQRRKPLVVVGYTIAAIARPLIGLATAAWQVLAIRVGDRVGKGVRSSARDALIADSVHPSIRGRAFGVHQAADNMGAVVGPLIAFALLRWEGLTLRHLFWLAAFPGLLSVLVVVLFVRETPRRVAPPPAEKPKEHLTLAGHLGGRFWAVLVVIFVFTLGNSTDAFLLLRAKDLGVPVALAPILWACLNFVKSLSNVPGGIFSDRVGRRAALVLGWLIYAASYFLFARASQAWQAWVLFAFYGLYFGFTEGTERAMISDLVPSARRGAAYGWYYLAIGIGALPASLLFGLLWDRLGAPVAFEVGAALSLAAAIGIALVPVTRVA